MKRYKILIDTDLGADVDDLLALYAAIKSPMLDIVGVTTVCGNVTERAQGVKKFLHLAGRGEIPVYQGCQNGFRRSFSANRTIAWEEDFDKAEYQPDNKGDTSGEQAIEFILSCAKKYKKELCILAIGPATNVARAIEKDAETMRGVERIVMMGGAFFVNRPEWNILCDVEGADLLIKSELPLYMVGIDVTEKTRLPFWLQEEITSQAHLEGAKGYVCRMGKRWMDYRKFAITLHDPLALYAIIHPEFLHFKKQRIAVETEGTHTRGMMMNYSQTNLYPKDRGYEVYVADYVDGERVMQTFFEEVMRSEE